MNALSRTSTAACLRQIVKPTVVASGMLRRGRVAAAPSKQRFFGSGQPESQSMKAKLFEGQPEKEGWETITNVTYAAAAVLLAMVAMAPDTSIQTWANNEARARLELKASGKVTEFEFGKHYNTTENMFDFEKLDSKGYYDPFGEEEEDEEEEDEEEDEEDDDDDDDE